MLDHELLKTQEMSLVRQLKIGSYQGWHILRIKFKKSSPADKIGFNWRKLDKSGENWRKLILTIEGERKGQVF